MLGARGAGRARAPATTRPCCAQPAETKPVSAAKSSRRTGDRGEPAACSAHKKLGEAHTHARGHAPSYHVHLAPGPWI